MTGLLEIMLMTLIFILGWMVIGTCLWPSCEPSPGEYERALQKLEETHPVGGPHLLIAAWPLAAYGRLFGWPEWLVEDVPEDKED